MTTPHRARYLSRSERETKRIAKNLTKSLTGGTVVALEGCLGSGKTVFVKGFAQGLGVTDIVQSPSFIIMNVYRVKQKNVTKFVHVDCYRLDAVEELSSVGLEEYTDDSNAIVVIEWADKIKTLLPANTVTVTFKIKSEQEREITVSRQQ